MTGRYGNGPKRGRAPSFEGADIESNPDWEPKHPVSIRRVSRGPNSDTLSVRNLLPPEWAVIRIRVNAENVAKGVIGWQISDLSDEAKDEGS